MVAEERAKPFDHRSHSRRWPPEDLPVEVASAFEGLALCAAILHAIWNAFLRSGAARMVSILSTKNRHMTP
ncbi:hypothetical protein [Rhizobium sp. 768_B6_N1_8]|jgi:hypothetical protein|uniref:hypothetical protein n=1 Tax=unclassified Rhizobium TaxID=2613769 RepID=UPI003F246D01